MVAEVKNQSGLTHHFLQQRSRIAQLLSEVDDPEIPGISIVDLGMVIDIRNEQNEWIIDLAPTYSGCPAIDVIPILVKSRLQDAGLDNINAMMILTPPWSTDWISEEGKVKLHSYGIAPPHRQARGPEGHPKLCPQCGSSDLSLISRYGSTPCKAAYQCKDCLEPFEYFKCY